MIWYRTFFLEASSSNKYCCLNSLTFKPKSCRSTSEYFLNIFCNFLLQRNFSHTVISLKGFLFKFVKFFYRRNTRLQKQTRMQKHRKHIKIECNGFENLIEWAKAAFTWASNAGWTEMQRLQFSMSWHVNYGVSFTLVSKTEMSFTSVSKTEVKVTLVDWIHHIENWRCCISLDTKWYAHVNAA